MKKYPSRYSPGKDISENQYIIELICEKNAARNNKELPIKFWQLPEWKTFYKSQLRKCKALLEKYSSEAIIKGLKDNEAKSIYSLFAPWLDGIINKHQIALNKTPVIKDAPEMAGDSFNRESFKNNKNLIDKLDE